MCPCITVYLHHIFAYNYHPKFQVITVCTWQCLCVHAMVLLASFARGWSPINGTPIQGYVFPLSPPPTNSCPPHLPSHLSARGSGSSEGKEPASEPVHAPDQENSSQLLHLPLPVCLPPLPHFHPGGQRVQQVVGHMHLSCCMRQPTHQRQCSIMWWGSRGPGSKVASPALWHPGPHHPRLALQYNADRQQGAISSQKCYSNALFWVFFVSSTHIYSPPKYCF